MGKEIIRRIKGRKNPFIERAARQPREEVVVKQRPMRQTSYSGEKIYLAFGLAAMHVATTSSNTRRKVKRSDARQQN
jgi:hypothetical protein